QERSLFRAVSMTQTMPRVLQGSAPTLAISNLNDFTIRAGRSSASVQGGFEAINHQKQVNPGQYKPENGSQYPRSQFGNALFQIGQLIKAQVGLEVAFTD